MKPYFMLLFLCYSQIANVQAMDFDRLASAIYVHEGGTKTRFPYGVERITRDGKRYPYNVAKAKEKCLQSINRASKQWYKGGCKGDFIAFLGKTYAQDPNWAKGVKQLYEHKKINRP